MVRSRERRRLWAKAHYVPAQKGPRPPRIQAAAPAPVKIAPVIVRRSSTPILATPKQVREWLAQSLYLCGGTRLDAADRVALMTHEEALAEANRRRAQLGDAPMRLIFVKARA